MNYKLPTVLYFYAHEAYELMYPINFGQVNLSGLDLHPPVTFRLKHGSGPVFVGAEHVACEFVLALLTLTISC